MRRPAVWVLVLAAGPASGHEVGRLQDEFRAWSGDPAVLVPLIMVALAYGIGLARLWKRAGRGRGVTRWRVSAFAGGLAILATALLSPLEALSQVSFAAHMAQHMILIAFAPPLLILGRPLAPFILALPMLWRKPLGRWLAGGVPGRAGRFLTAAPMAAALHGAALWIWHAPSAYQAALADNLVHNAEHLSLFGTALVFWWSVIHSGQNGRFGYGSGVFALLLTAMHSKLLGVLITFAPAPLYPAYASGKPLWGLSALEDQQWAGLIMLLPCEAVYLITALTLLGLWLNSAGCTPWLKSDEKR